MSWPSTLTCSSQGLAMLGKGAFVRTPSPIGITLTADNYSPPSGKGGQGSLLRCRSRATPHASTSLRLGRFRLHQRPLSVSA
jgi:hypothetical protein